MFVVKRLKENPILKPDRDHHWEASATFNLSPIKIGKEVYGLYRAMSSSDHLRTPDQVSTIGIAKSPDGAHFEDRRQFIVPSEDWDKFGCEDPRITYFEGKYYIFYTALSVYPFAPEGIRVAVAISDDLKKVKEKHRVTTFNSKAMTLFPERVGGKVTVIFSAHTDGAAAKMSIAQADKVEDFFSPDFWDDWYTKMSQHTMEDLRRIEFDHVEVGATPVKTERGWLLIYSYIENFFPNPSGLRPKFGIEALLLDSDNPLKVIGRTKGPFLVPEESYEISGHVSNIAFPSGAIVDGDTLNIYYGSADTTVSMARVNIHDLVLSIDYKTETEQRFKRIDGNPVMEPIAEHPWESKAVFNPAAIDLGGKVHILYRAMSEDNTSTIGYASSSDAVTIEDRLPEPIYVPREDFENKKIDGGNSGCEDPRISKIGDDLYMCYTAFDGVGPPRVAVSSIKEKDFLARKFSWTKPELITPPGVDDKDTCIFPEKIGGKYFIIHRIGTDICGDYIESLDFKDGAVNKCIRIFGPRPGMWDGTKVGIAGPPVKTEHGWLLLYHAVSEIHHTYRVGAVLLDAEDPTIVLSRSADSIFYPEEKFEKEGIINNVVFPCGMVIRDSIVYIYYGGADKVLGIATMKLEAILDPLVKSIHY
jgi:predicted GH43/DUF377 family glycosyl hydrolase